MPLSLYLLEQTGRVSYDEWDSCVVAAESADAARYVHPGGYEWGTSKWNESSSRGWDGWDVPSNIKVTHVGTAVDAVPAGVVCASFNAG